MTQDSALSPICRHVGLYAYTRDALMRFTSYPESPYEKLEGLEQLRLLENDMTIKCVQVEPPKVKVFPAEMSARWYPCVIVGSLVAHTTNQ